MSRTFRVSAAVCRSDPETIPIFKRSLLFSPIDPAEMTSRAEEGEAGGAGVGEAVGTGVEAAPAAPPSLPSWITNVYQTFRILVLSEDRSRADFITNGLLTFGYSVSSATDCGAAIPMLMNPPDAFHMVVIDDAVVGLPLKILFHMLKTWAENVCIIVFTSDYNIRVAKIYLGQGVQLVVPYDQISSFYFAFWQFILVKYKFLLDLNSLKEQRKRTRWNKETRGDFQVAVPFAGPDPTARSVAELMNVTGINVQTVGNYMRQRDRNPRASAAGAGPSRADAVGFRPSRSDATGAGPVMQPPFAQAEAGALALFVGAVGSRDPVLETGDDFFSDLDFFHD